MSRLHRLARQGNYEAIGECLAEGMDMNALSVHHQTPLMLAAQNGYADTARLLLKAGADPNAVTPNGQTALHMAAHRRQLGVVQVLVANGANVNAKSHGGETPLLCAAQFNQVEVCAFLQSQGAETETRDREGRTAQDWLALGGIQGEFPPVFPEDFSGATGAGDKPMAREATETEIHKFMAEGLSADEYAAKHGRLILVQSYGAYHYQDAEREAWAQRVAEVLFTPGLLDECEERYLRGDELEQARSCRARQAKRQARREQRRRLAR